MQFDKVTIAIRPRSSWEGIDLGFAMARRWFFPLWLLWISTALPAALLLHLVFHNNLVLAILLTWWLKPVYESLPLFWLSRVVFNQHLTLPSVFKLLIMVCRPRLFARLTTHRFSFNRSFFLPVTLLENLKGKAYSHRTKLLGQDQNIGLGLTFICLVFEIVLIFSLSTLLITLIPEEFRWFSIGDTFFADNTVESLLESIIYIAAISIIAPFYCAAGFSLYLNRRTKLEAWDIELNFRQLMLRHTEKKARTSTKPLKSAGFIIVFLFLSLLSLFKQPALADVLTKNEASEIIREVLKDDDFGQKKTEKGWIPIVKDKKETRPMDLAWLNWFNDLSRVLGVLMEVVLWVLGGIIIIYILYKISKNQGWFMKQSGMSLPEKRIPKELFGLDITKDSLPHDIIQEVRKLLDKTDFRGALSLLYRATLTELVHRFEIEIPKSATEEECVQLVKTIGSKKETIFIKNLTDTWLIMAYAQYPPERDTLEKIAHSWQTLYRPTHE